MLSSLAAQLEVMEVLSFLKTQTYKKVESALRKGKSSFEKMKTNEKTKKEHKG